MQKLLAVLGLVACLAACASTAAETTAASEAQVTDAPLLDCTQPGSFPEAAMKALGGTYERGGEVPANGLRSFTIGPLQDISGWGGKHATYTREMAAPCMDIAAMGDGSGFTAANPIPMTSTACAGQTGTITTLFDNPALGAFLAFEDASGLPFGKDFYFVTSSRLEADGQLSALCLANGSTGDTFLVTKKRP